MPPVRPPTDPTVAKRIISKVLGTHIPSMDVLMSGTAPIEDTDFDKLLSGKKSKSKSSRSSTKSSQKPSQRALQLRQQHQEQMKQEVIPSSVSITAESYGLGPTLPTCHLNEGAVEMIKVIYAMSLSYFWIQLARDESKVDRLAYDMRVYYGDIEESPHETLPFLPQMGMICAGCFMSDGAWYRARVLRVIPAQELGQGDGSSPEQPYVEVLYLDYGNQEILPRQRLRPLADQFSSTPPSAYNCCLSEVMPRGGNIWPPESIQVFESKIMSSPSPLSTRVVKVKDFDLSKLYFLELVLPNGGGSLAQYLIENKIAKPVKNVEIWKTMFMGTPEPTVNKDQTKPVEVPVLEALPRDEPVAIKPTQDTKLEISQANCRNESMETWVNEQADDTLDNMLDSQSNRGAMLSDTDSLPDDLDEAAVTAEQTFSELPPIEQSNITVTLVLGSKYPKLRQRELTIDINDGLNVMLAHINTPSDFYVHLVEKETSKILDELNEELNRHYSRFEQTMMSRFFENYQPGVGDVCCAWFDEDECFYRAVIIRVKEELHGDPSIRVHYLDYGNMQWIPASKVFPLSSNFCELPAQAIHCCLSNTKPPMGDSWPRIAIREFEALTGYRNTIFAYLMEGKDKDRISEPLSVALENLCVTDDVTFVNMALVQKGYAIIINDQNPPTENSQTKSQHNMENMKSWNPMEEDYLDGTNCYHIDKDDPMIATLQCNENSEKRVCKFFNTQSGCFRGERCRFEHVALKDGMTEVELVYSIDDVDCITLPATNGWVPVNVTAVYNPGRFYVVCPFGIQTMGHPAAVDHRDDEGYEGSTMNDETLVTLQERLNEHYGRKTRRDRDLTAFANCELIAARYAEDGNWYRGKVVDVDADQKLVEVFYVDYGNSEWVEEKNIYCMEAQFLHYPFQAVECFLYGIEPTNTDKGWTEEAKTRFSEMTDGKVLLAHIRSRMGKRVLYVDLYDTEDSDEMLINQKLVRLDFAKNVLENYSLTYHSLTKSSNTSEMNLVPG